MSALAPMLATGAPSTKAAEPGPPRSEGCVPLPHRAAMSERGAESRKPEPACAGLGGLEELPPQAAARGKKRHRGVP